MFSRDVTKREVSLLFCSVVAAVRCGRLAGQLFLCASSSSSSSWTMDGSEARRQKVDGTDRLCVSERAQCVPSRVLHLRHLPLDVSEQEVLALALPFGRVSKLITLKHKNQAFVEMASEEAAVTMVNYYTSATPTVRNQPIFIQYSTHRELKTDNLTNQ
eukprot:superscaffoldBa00012013_g25479